MCEFIVKSGKNCSRPAKYGGYCPWHKAEYKPVAEPVAEEVAEVVAEEEVAEVVAEEEVAEVVAEEEVAEEVAEVVAEEVAESGLFEMIFDMETGGPRVENLRSVDEAFYERFDSNKLAFILNNLAEIKKLYRPNARDALCIDKYYEKSKSGNLGLGTVRVKYHQNGKDTIRGRYQALGSLSGQNMVREVRHTIFDDYYVDMDMDNCHPVITVWLCNKMSIACGYMSDYVRNREEHIRDLIKANPSLTRDDVKRLFLSINYGGSALFDSVKNKTHFLINYEKEATMIKSAVCKKLRYFKTVSDASRKERGVDYNYEGSAMSHICCFVENQLLMIILDYLRDQINDVSGSILCFDGIMIRRDKFKDSFLSDLESIFAGLQIPIKLSVKAMKPINLAGMGYDPRKRYSFGDEVGGLDLSKFNNYKLDEAGLSDKLEKATDSKLQAAIICNTITTLLGLLPKELIRVEDGASTYDVVSRSVFTLRDISLLIKSVYAYILNDGDYFILAKSHETIRFKDGDVKTVRYVNMGGLTSAAFKQVSFGVSVGDNVYPINLKSCLSSCYKGIMYRDVDVVPHSPLVSPSLGDTFNLFGTYQHKYDPNFVIDQDLVDLWVNHVRDILAAGNEEVGEYFLNWFAHLLQKPGVKTGTVPLIRGRPGCGKNMAINIFQRYVLSPSMGIVCPDLEKLFSRFNTGRLGKTLIVLDEAVDSYDRKMNNKMKNFITEDRVQVEAKGKDILEVGDFSNYMIITNNDFASIVEKGDRRYVCVEASPDRFGDHQYFNNMAAKLLNVNGGRHLFHWLLRRDLSSFNLNAIPKTSYKKELSSRQTDNVVKWLLNMYDNIVDEEDDTVYSLSSSDWYRQYTEWCRCVGGETKIHSLSVFSGIMTREGFPIKETKIRVNNTRKNFRPRLISRTILEENLEDYMV